MFNFRLAQEFRKRAADLVGPFPRGVVSATATASSAFDNSRLGAYAALGAIGLGGIMLVANIAHNRCEVPIAALPGDPPSVASDPSKGLVAKRAPTPEVDVAPIAAAPPAPASSPMAATDKSAARIDTTTTGAIAPVSPPHPKHKPHLKKTKELDSRT